MSFFLETAVGHQVGVVSGDVGHILKLEFSGLVVAHIEMCDPGAPLLNRDPGRTNKNPIGGLGRVKLLKFVCIVADV